MIFQLVSLWASATMSSAVPPPAQVCLEARTTIAAGLVLKQADFEPVECGDTITPSRFEAATGSTHASRALAAGDVVRAWPGAAEKHVQPGDVLVLSVVAGPVKVEREVVAMQAAAPGSRLFVRDHDGQIISVTFENVDR